MSQKGFTLIEILIYAALVALMLSFTITNAYSLIEYTNRLNTTRALLEQHEFLIQKLQWVMGGVQTITTPTSGATSTSLSVNKSGNPQNPFMIDLANGVVRLSRGGNPPLPLTNPKIMVSNLSFTNITTTNTTALRATATLTTSISTIPFDATMIIK